MTDTFRSYDDTWKEEELPEAFEGLVNRYETTKGPNTEVTILEARLAIGRELRSLMTNTSPAEILQYARSGMTHVRHVYGWNEEIAGSVSFLESTLDRYEEELHHEEDVEFLAFFLPILHRLLDAVVYRAMPYYRVLAVLDRIERALPWYGRYDNDSILPGGIDCGDENGDHGVYGRFLRDISEHPNDSTSRLIFADWLEERSMGKDAIAAELLRLQALEPNDDETIQRERGIQSFDLLRELGSQEPRLEDRVMASSEQRNRLFIGKRECRRPARDGNKNYPAHESEITEIAQSIDRRTTASISCWTLRLWDTETSAFRGSVELIPLAQPHAGQCILSLAVHNDGQCVAILIGTKKGMSERLLTLRKSDNGRWKVIHGQRLGPYDACPPYSMRFQGDEVEFQYENS